MIETMKLARTHMFTRLNTLLLLAIICINLFVIVTPVVPAITYAFGSHTAKRQQLSTKLHSSNHNNLSTTAPAHGTAPSQPNAVIIPAMLLDQPVLEGADTYAILNKGIWRWPAGSTPDKGGNTVLIGHRFTYTVPKGVFYYLDKLRVGDEIGMTWNNTQYVYKVSQIKTVSPSEVGIQNNTTDARLTLFTCTPLAWPKNRLVVVASLVSPLLPVQPAQSAMSADGTKDSTP